MSANENILYKLKEICDNYPTDKIIRGELGVFEEKAETAIKNAKAKFASNVKNVASKDNKPMFEQNVFDELGISRGRAGKIKYKR